MVGLQENKNPCWSLGDSVKCFNECPLSSLHEFAYCILKWFDFFQRSFCPCGGANFQSSFTAMVSDLHTTVWSNFGRYLRLYYQFKWLVPASVLIVLMGKSSVDAKLL